MRSRITVTLPRHDCYTHVTARAATATAFLIYIAVTRLLHFRYSEGGDFPHLACRAHFFRPRVLSDSAEWVRPSTAFLTRVACTYEVRVAMPL